MKTHSPDIVRLLEARDRLWEELHRPPPPIGHPIPRLDRSPVRPPGNGRLRVGRWFEKGPFREAGSRRVAWLLLLAAALGLAGSGCTVITYRGPNGERFSRQCVGATTSLSSLVVDLATNGVRRVELRGYSNDSAQALGTVTEAAVKAALQSVK